MPEAYIYDHVVPRAAAARPMAPARGHRAGVATVPLKPGAQQSSSSVDDVVLNSRPVGETGSDIARFAALNAGLGGFRRADQPLLRLGLDAVNFAAAQIMAGQHEL